MEPDNSIVLGGRNLLSGAPIFFHVLPVTQKELNPDLGEKLHALVPRAVQSSAQDHELLGEDLVEPATCDPQFTDPRCPRFLFSAKSDQHFFFLMEIQALNTKNKN